MVGIRVSRVVVRFLGLVLLLGACAVAQVRAQAGPSEYDLKAAFVYQFLAYVTWPDSPNPASGPLRIGVVGASELADNLAALASNQGASARAIEIRRLAPDADPRDLHVLFVAAGFSGAAAAQLQTAVDNAVLTVTEDLPRPSDSMINFEVIDSKVRFDVALGLARQSGLDVSARLLQVALRVLEQP